MRKISNTILSGIWKRMWFPALLLYLSYFLYRWIGIYVSKILGQISDIVFYQNSSLNNSGLLEKLIITFLFSLILMPFIDLITNVFIFRRGLRYETYVIDEVFKKDYEKLQVWQSNEWSGRISQDPLQYRQMAVITPVRIGADVTVLTVAVFNLLQTNIFLTLILAIGILISVGMQFAFKERDNQLREGIRKYQDEVIVYQSEMVKLHSFWSLYRCQSSFPDKMKSLFERHYNETKKHEIELSARLELFQDCTMIGLFIASLLLGLAQVERGLMTPGNFVTVYFMMLQVRIMAESVLTNLQVLRGYGAQEDRMKELLQGEEIFGNEEVKEWTTLHFEGVSYIYPGTQNGMQERNFSVNYGEIIEVAGNNGSGKTTLMKLICGVFPSKNGYIKLDESCFNVKDLKGWRDKIGYMQQFPDIFPGTVRENVQIGNLNAPQEQVDFVLDKVQLREMAERQLNGRKEELSGGEIKRVELARILLRMEQCELLILDEPFENLDTYGRKIVQEVLGCTTKCRILINHNKDMTTR